MRVVFFLIADYRHDLLISEAAKDRSSNRVVKKGLFAPASPASSSNISPSAGIHKPSLRPTETGDLLLLWLFFFFFDSPTHTVPIYDGRRHQLKIPEELRNVPAILSRYPGEIPYHSLVLVAYTVSLYRAAQGSRKDQPTIPLNISFAVVLQDEPLEYDGSDDGEDAQDGDLDVVEEDDDEETTTIPSDPRVKLEDLSGEEFENQSDVAVEEQSDN